MLDVCPTIRIGLYPQAHSVICRDTMTLSHTEDMFQFIKCPIETHHRCHDQLLSVIPMNFKLSEVTAAAGETDIRYLRVWADADARADADGRSVL